MELKLIRLQCIPRNLFFPNQPFFSYGIYFQILSDVDFVKLRIGEIETDRGFPKKNPKLILFVEFEYDSLEQLSDIVLQFDLKTFRTQTFDLYTHSK